jgi:hypothetical protein
MTLYLREASWQATGAADRLESAQTAGSLEGAGRKHQVCQDNRQSLKENRSFRAVVEVLHTKHLRVEVERNLTQERKKKIQGNRLPCTVFRSRPDS